MRVTALAGGAGAAKFLKGLVARIDPGKLTIIGNTGDDEVIHGLYISPDLDIVTYTLAGRVSEKGWGFAGDTMNTLESLRTYGVDAWFTLGDRDIGTHLARTTWLSEGLTLSDCAERIASSLGVNARIIPMSNDPVRTKITTSKGDVRSFQEYFVRHRHSERVDKVVFEGIEAARPAPGVIEAIENAEVVIVCPSNPVVSVEPILRVKGIREALVKRRKDVFAISPIVQGAALKGPAAELLPLRGVSASAAGVAELYRDFAGNFISDRVDEGDIERIRELGMNPAGLDTIMSSPEKAAGLAQEILEIHRTILKDAGKVA